MKTEFVSLVSHELRTPLTSIKGYVDLLLEEEIGPLEPAVREPLETVRASTDRLIDLVNNLLDVARIDDGTLEVSRAPTDLRRVIRVAVQAIRPRVEAKGQTLTTDVPNDLPLALVDGDRTTEVLLRLLANAHNYTPPGGSITVTARADGDVLRVEIVDTGVGIAAENQERLFTRFYRVPNRATQEVAGTGLGLAISRSLVQAMGGEIDVRSEAGQGSAFVMTLPVAVEGSEPSIDTTGAASDGHGDVQLLAGSRARHDFD
jgi:signal transduction histidine kinase